MNVPDLLAHGLQRGGRQLCVVEGDRSLTYREVDDRANRLARAIVESGVGPGDRVAFLGQNDVEHVEIHLAAQRAGAVFVPLNFRLAASEHAAVVADCSPRLLIHGEPFAEIAEGLDVDTIWHLGAAGVGESYDEALAASAETPLGRALDGATPSLIVYTSGTTGRAKGVVISNAALWARICMSCIEIPVREDDRLLVSTPMFHASSAIAYGFLYRGCSVFQMRTFDTTQALELIRSERLTHALLVPAIINRLLGELERQPVSLDTLRLVVYGGSAIAPTVIDRAVETMGCGFLQVYGLTEAVNATVLREQDHDVRAHPELVGSAGAASASYEVSVLGLDGEPAPPGEVGEIVLKGPCLMDGYWGAPEETAEVFHGQWLRTGDLGHVSGEGYLFVTDRLKDMIVSGAENVYAREVEDVILEYPGVFEAAVIGIPSETWGEAVHAIVVPKDGAEIDTGKLLAHCRGRLAHYKVPKSVELAQTHLARNSVGKVLKRTIRATYWEGKERAVG